MGFPVGSLVQNRPELAEDAFSVPGSGRYSGGRNSNPLLHSCLGHPMDKGPWGLLSMRSQAHGLVNELAHVTIYYNAFYVFIILCSRKHFSPLV